MRTIFHHLSVYFFNQADVGSSVQANLSLFLPSVFLTTQKTQNRRQGSAKHVQLALTEHDEILALPKIIKPSVKVIQQLKLFFSTDS